MFSYVFCMCVSITAQSFCLQWICQGKKPSCFTAWSALWALPCRISMQDLAVWELSLPWSYHQVGVNFFTVSCFHCCEWPQQIFFFRYAKNSWWSILYFCKEILVVSELISRVIPSYEIEIQSPRADIKESLKQIYYRSSHLRRPDLATWQVYRAKELTFPF